MVRGSEPAGRGGMTPSRMTPVRTALSTSAFPEDLETDICSIPPVYHPKYILPVIRM